MGWWRKKKPKFERAAKSEIAERGAKLLEELIECCDGKSNPIKFFSAHQIQKATQNFSLSNQVLSEISYDFFYEWYTGKNENYPMLLIKKYADADINYYVYIQENFWRDIAISSMVSGHKNFLKLIGCCLESEVPVLVYNAVNKHYQVKISELSWKRRLKVAEDVATALAYLHTAFPRPFVYRNMSPDHILLDEDGVAKLNGFSLCVSIPKGETFVKVFGSYFGDIYKDSKYMRDGVVSVETDVYAIGMLMQQLLNGFPEVTFDLNTGIEISDDSIIETDVQRRLMEEGRMDEIADPKMLKKMGEISEEELSQMKAFLMLSHRCISEVEVPTMVEVAKELKKIQRSTKNNSSSPQDIASSSYTRL